MIQRGRQPLDLLGGRLIALGHGRHRPSIIGREQFGYSSGRASRSVGGRSGLDPLGQRFGVEQVGRGQMVVGQPRRLGELVRIGLDQCVHQPPGLDVRFLEEQSLFFDKRPGSGRKLVRTRLAGGVQGPFLEVLLEGIRHRSFDQLNDPLADHESNHHATSQPPQGLDQPAPQLFEVLPEGHGAFAEQVVFMGGVHQLNSSIPGGPEGGNRQGERSVTAPIIPDGS